MNWFLWAAIAAVNFTIYSLIIRFYLKDQGDAKTFAALSDLTLSGFLLLAAWIMGPMFEVEWIHLVLIAVAGGLYAGSSLLLIWGRQLEEVSRVSIARQTTTIVVFVGGVLLFDEPFTLAKLAGVSLIVIGTIVAFYEQGHLNFGRGMIITVAGSVLAAASALIGKTIVDDNVSPSLYVGLVSLIASGILIVGLPNSISRAVNEVKLQTFHLLVVSAFLGLSIFSVYRAYQVGEASRVGPVYGTATIMSVLAGIYFLDEKERVWQKVAGGSIAFAGVAALGLL